MENIFLELLKVLGVTCKNSESIRTFALQHQVKWKIHFFVNEFCVLMTTGKILNRESIQ